MFGSPRQLPYPPIPATTPGSTRRVSGWSAAPNRSGSMTATGRAPMARMSRTIPPTPASGAPRVPLRSSAGWRSYAGSEVYEHRGEETEPVKGRAGQRLDGVFRVRHDADHVAGLVGDRGDVALRTVRVAPHVPGHHAALRLQHVEGQLVGDVAALAALERDADLLALGVPVGPRAGDADHAQVLVAVAEVQVLVAG